MYLQKVKDLNNDVREIRRRVSLTKKVIVGELFLQILKGKGSKNAHFHRTYDLF